MPISVRSSVWSARSSSSASESMEEGQCIRRGSSPSRKSSASSSLSLSSPSPSPWLRGSSIHNRHVTNSTTAAQARFNSAISTSSSVDANYTTLTLADGGVGSPSLVPPRRTSLAHLSRGIESRRAAETSASFDVDLETEIGGERHGQDDEDYSRRASRARGLGALGSQSAVFLPLVHDLGVEADHAQRSQRSAGLPPRSTSRGPALASASLWDLSSSRTAYNPPHQALEEWQALHPAGPQSRSASGFHGFKSAGVHLLQPASPTIHHRPVAVVDLLELSDDTEDDIVHDHAHASDYIISFPLPPSPASTIPASSPSLSRTSSVRLDSSCVFALVTPSPPSSSDGHVYITASDEPNDIAVAVVEQHGTPTSPLRRWKATRRTKREESVQQRIKRRSDRSFRSNELQTWKMDVNEHAQLAAGLPVTPPMSSSASFNGISAPAVPPRAQSRPNRNLRPVPSAASIPGSASSVRGDTTPGSVSHGPTTPPSSTPGASQESLEMQKDSGSSATSGAAPVTPRSDASGSHARGRRRSEDKLDAGGYFAGVALPEGRRADRMLDLCKLSIANSNDGTPHAADRSAVPTPRSSSLTAASTDGSSQQRLGLAPRGFSLSESSTPAMGHAFRLPSTPMLRSPSDSDAWGHAPQYPQTARKVSADSVMSSASGSSQSYISAAHSRASSFTRSTITPGPAAPTAAGGYMNARMAREADHQRELERRKKGTRDTSVGVVVKEDGTVVRDGYKILDGQPKRSSSSGVYTPPTYPGATMSGPSSANSYRQSVSPFGPASESMFSDSASVTSPRGSGFFNTPQLSSRKSAFGAAIAKVAGPLRSPRDSVVPTASSTDSAASGRLPNDGWRKSTLYSPSRGETDRYRSPTAATGVPLGGSPRYVRTSSSGTKPGGEVEPDRSPLNGVYLHDGGRVVASPQRMRALSEALQHATPATDGMGLGYGITLRSLDAVPRSVSEGHTPQPGSSDDEGRGQQRAQRPRNVKGLTLPLTAAKALHEAVSDPSTQLQAPVELAPPPALPVSAPASTSGDSPPLQSGPTMAGVSKGVKRKPVPQIKA